MRHATADPLPLAPDVEVLKAERLLRITAVVFAAAVTIHGADHLRRGPDVVTEVVLGAGTIQFVLGAVAVVLVFRRHRLAPMMAIYVGFISAVGFAAAHLLPQWSAFSDPFTGGVVAPGVTGFSWFAALFEIAADIAFGVAGLRMQAAPKEVH
jgi:hypothetical protein